MLMGFSWDKHGLDCHKKLQMLMFQLSTIKLDFDVTKLIIGSNLLFQSYKH